MWVARGKGLPPGGSYSNCWTTCTLFLLLFLQTSESTEDMDRRPCLPSRSLPALILERVLPVVPARNKNCTRAASCDLPLKRRHARCHFRGFFLSFLASTAFPTSPSGCAQCARPQEKKRREERKRKSQKQGREAPRRGSIVGASTDVVQTAKLWSASDQHPSCWPLAGHTRWRKGDECASGAFFSRNLCIEAHFLDLSELLSLTAGPLLDS